MWDKNKIEKHKIACKLLEEIKDIIPGFIKKNKNITEFDLSNFINKQFKLNNLKINKDPPIVAFNENTSFKHYFPKKSSKRLIPNTIILVDVWSRLNEKNSPYSDITWMFYYGKKIPKEILNVFDIIKYARDCAINYIKSQLKLGNIPTGKEIDEIAINIIKEKGYFENILHRTGHSIGYRSPHGVNKHLNEKNNIPILKNMGYTIEPGIYIKNKFGLRSEIDFYIDNNMNLIVTTPIQEKIIKIKP